MQRQLGLYLDEALRKKVAGGGHNFFQTVIAAFEDAGFAVSLFSNTEQECAQSESRDGFSLFHKSGAKHDRALTANLSCFFPFWLIESENPTCSKGIANKAFSPGETDSDTVSAFFRQWRRRLGKRHPWEPSEKRDFVLVLLQGNLTVKGPGQSSAPIDMIREVLEHDRFRPVVITLDPDVQYSVEEMDALEEFRPNPRIRFAFDPVHSLLEACDYTVSENANTAFEGFFYRKPAILYAQARFHHICENVHETGAELAFRNVLSKRHPYPRYVHWFLQENSINAGQDDAKDQVMNACRAYGWEI